MIEAIESRSSIRTYTGASLSERDLAYVEACIANPVPGPFGSTPRFTTVTFGLREKKEGIKPGTYGIIKGADTFITGIVKKGSTNLIDFGYSFETIILSLTACGLGTCWLAGTFKRDAFTRNAALGEHEIIPAVTPVGYDAGRRSIQDRIIRSFAGSKKRKPWSELFFTPSGGQVSTGHSLKEALEHTRIAPSASNKQPWRLIVDDHDTPAGTEKPEVHFFLHLDRKYETLFKEFRVQEIDMGICMAHFALSCNERGKPGSWHRLENMPKNGQPREPALPGIPQSAQWEYIATWKMEG